MTRSAEPLGAAFEAIPSVKPGLQERNHQNPRLNALPGLLREAFLAFGYDNVPRMAAAVAYSSMFAIAPLLFFALAVAAGVLNNVDVREQVFSFVAQNLSENAATFVQEMIPGSDRLAQSSLIASLLGFGTLFMGATSLFVQIQNCLNTLWGAEPITGQGPLQLIKTRLSAFAIILLLGVVITCFLVGNIYLSSIAEQLGNTIGVGAFFARVATFVVGAALLTLAFAAMYKLLPSVSLRWREVWFGAAITSVLFSVAQLAISWYLGQFAPGNAFGVAGALVVLLMWVNFSSMVFLFGAEVTWVFSQKYGSGAGGADSVAKKLFMKSRGSTLDTRPSSQERESLLLAIQEQKPVAYRAVRQLQHTMQAEQEAQQAARGAGVQQPGQAGLPGQRPVRLPSVFRAAWNAVSAILAVPAVLVLRLLPFKKQPQTPGQAVKHTRPPARRSR